MRAISCPSWKKLTLGRAGMPSLVAKSVLAGAFTVKNATRPCSSTASSASVGNRCRHGPHHSALKTNSAGIGDRKTFSSNSALVISLTPLMAGSLLHLPSWFPVTWQGRRSIPSSAPTWGTTAPQ